MKRSQVSPRLRLAGAVLALTTVGLVSLPAGSAMADNAGDQQFSGYVRNNSAYAGAQILNGLVNARLNIGESVAVADSRGLNKGIYTGTSTGELAVPGSLSSDPTARSYARSAVVGAGFIGLNVQPMKTESFSTTAVDGVLETLANPLANLDLSPIGKLSALDGKSDSNWNPNVLGSGGRLAYSDSNVGTLQLLNGGIPGLNLPIPIPGFSSLFPVGTAELGQNTSEISLVGDTAACPTGLAVQSRATWDFADVHLFNGFIDISLAGNAGGGTPDSAVMTAKANGVPGGARVISPELGDVTVNVGTMSLSLQPGLALEVGKILKDANGLGNILSGFVDGEIALGGVTDVHQAADGSWAHAALNGLEANLSLLPVTLIAPDGLGSVEIGAMRGEVDAKAPAGGLNCSSAGTDTSTATDTSAATSTATDTSAATSTAADTSAATSTAADTSAATSTATDASAATSTATDASAATSTATDTSAATSTATDTSAATSTATDTSAATSTATDTSAATSTATDASAATSTATDTSAATSTATDTSAATSTATDASAATSTATDASAATSTATDASAATSTATDASAATSTATDTSAATSTATDASAATSTATDTSAATSTATDASAATSTATDTSAATSTATDASAATSTATDTSAATSTATDASAATSTATDTSAATSTATDTSAATSTATDTSAATSTATDASAAAATDASTSTDSNSTQVLPPGTTSGNAAGPGGTGVLPNTGGVPIQLLGVAFGLLLVGIRLLGATRYWNKQLAR
jgi:hypothetical protein